ncbi:MAG: DUF4374 domain-containing protein [Sphingobacterium sp.]
MKLKFLHRPLALLLMGAAVTTSCSKSDGPNPGGGDVDSKYFIAATGDGDYDYLITADDLTQGSVSIAGNGLEVRGGYNWIYPNSSTAIGFIYQQGDPGVGLGIGIDQTGQIVPKGSEFLVESRFTTYGVAGGLAITAVSGQPVPDEADTYQSIFNIVNPDEGNAKTTKNFVTTNMTGTGEFFTFSGIVDAGDGTFLSAMVPSKVLPNTGGGGSTGDTDYPDSVWVAKFDTDLNLIKVYGDDRLSYSTGRMRSQYHSQIANDGTGNTYVFSGAFSEQTSKKAGVIRINNGEENFDPEYYWDLEAESGGYNFMKVWHIDGDYFLLNYYNKPNSTAHTDGYTKYAVINVAEQSFQWLESGFPAPDEITATSNAYSFDGQAFIPVTAENQKPAIYVIDPVTATATRGLEVDATSISGVGKLTHN